MSIVQTLVTDALFAVGAYGVGDNLDAADAQLCLRRLNRMLESWGNETQLCYSIAVDTLTMTPGTASYLTSALASTLRPVSIDYCTVTLNSIHYVVDVVDNQTFADISYPSSSATPRVLYPAPGSSTWTLNFYPTPDAAYTLNLSVRRSLNQPALALSDIFVGPPGYEKAIVDNLAVDIGPSFGRPPDQVSIMAAAEARRVLKRANYQPLIMDSPIASSRVSILSDDYVR